MDHYALRDRFAVDFGEKPFFAPFSMLLVGAKLRLLKKANPSLKIDIKGYKGLEYAARSGFFDLAGIEYGLQIGEARASENYLPITRINRESLEDTSGDQFLAIQDLVQRHADNVSAVLSRDIEEHKDLYDALSYSIREIMRNVFEHSGAIELYYCAQYWPKSNRVEFAMADFGMGIRRGLSENPNFRGLSNREALHMSLMPGVSGKTHKGDRHSEWHNSGYGLYMTNRLARNGGGNFVIASGDHSIHLGPKSKSDYPTSFPGTVVRFNLHAGRIGDVKTRLNEFREEGARIASNIKGAGNRPPSSMSMLLRKDYSGR
ncbi:hypothetical protein AMEJIAPC_01768 [Caulobacter sp. NIBR1757]|nr:hypothetical protein AMEJIAPC_01768 [Caulobacter sp. NIBR1757]